MIGYKTHWIGNECEGRLSDIETLFIGDIDCEPMQNGWVAENHVYLCSPAVNQMIERGSWNWFFDLLQNGLSSKIITLEVPAGELHKIPAQIRNMVHIMYMFHDMDFGLLKSNDSMKVVHGSYQLHCTTKCNMQEVTPDGYKHDK